VALENRKKCLKSMAGASTKQQDEHVGVKFTNVIPKMAQESGGAGVKKKFHAEAQFDETENADRVNDPRLKKQD